MKLCSCNCAQFCQDDVICGETARNESYLPIFRTAENCQIVIQAKLSHYQLFSQKPSLACWSSVGSCLIVYSASKECF